MDETAVFFENPSSRTITRRGEHTVSMATTGHEKTCVTVILSATSDGRKKKPLVIFKGKGKFFKIQQNVLFFNESDIKLFSLLF